MKGNIKQGQELEALINQNVHPDDRSHQRG